MRIALNIRGFNTCLILFMLLAIPLSEVKANELRPDQWSTSMRGPFTSSPYGSDDVCLPFFTCLLDFTGLRALCRFRFCCGRFDRWVWIVAFQLPPA